MSDQTKAATVDWCDANASPLAERLRMHADEMVGDGCWRNLLNEARAEIATLDQEVRLLRSVLRKVRWDWDHDEWPRAVASILHDPELTDAEKRSIQRALDNGSSEVSP